MNQKLIIGAAVLVLLVVLGGGGWYYWQNQKPENGRQEPSPSLSESQPAIAPLLDVDDILNKDVSIAVSVLGTSYTIEQAPAGEEIIWSRDDISVTLWRSGQGQPIISALFNFKRDITGERDEALKFLGMDPKIFPAPHNPEHSDLEGDRVYWAGGYGLVFVSWNELDIPGSLEKGSIQAVAVQAPDATRIRAVNSISEFLTNKMKAGISYPSTDDKLILWDKNNFEETIIAERLYGVWPTEDKMTPPGSFLGYKSDGRTYFEVSAVLDNDRDHRCVMEGDFCIYRIRNGEVVSRK